MADTLTYIASGIVESGSEDLELDSDNSFDSRSYEEEGECIGYRVVISVSRREMPTKRQQLYQIKYTMQQID